MTKDQQDAREASAAGHGPEGHDAPMSGGRDQPFLLRAMIVLGPVGLAIDIFLSLWVSHLHVTHSVMLQVEPAWIASESLGARAQLVDHDRKSVEDTRVELSYEPQGEAAMGLGELRAQGTVAQGVFRAPDRPPETGVLVARFFPPAGSRFDREIVERIPVEIVQQRAPRRGTHTVAGSMQQWAEDTDDQPEHLRIDLRTRGRLLAGFSNVFWVRVTDEHGVPHDGPIEVALVSGELGGKAGATAMGEGGGTQAPILASGELDSLGLFQFSGDLSSDVLRLEARVKPTADPPETKDVTRKFRLVSYAGGVRLEVQPHEEAGLWVAAQALSARRPVFVDVHGPDGAWIDTLTPPLGVRDEPRTWLAPEGTRGLVQFEGYHFTNSPDESSAIARVQLGVADDGHALDPLVDAQREAFDLAIGGQKGEALELERERKWLDQVQAKGGQLSATERERTRAWLIGTLPIEVHGPPAALSTRAREDEAMATFKMRWFFGLRVFLLGGGALFMAILVLAFWQAHAQTAAATRALFEEVQKGDAADPDDMLDDVGHVAQARREMLGRGAIALGIAVAALILTVMLLESLVWVA